MKFILLLLFPSLVIAQTISPNMSMPIPIPGVTTGPDWANDINASLTIIDGHNHSPGSGVQITPSGININSDLTCNNSNITAIRASRFQIQSSALATASDLNQFYDVNGDAYFNDGAGNQIRITQGGSLAGAAGTITGLPSGTASASYSAGTFVWQSATNTAANMDAGSYIFRNNTASSNGVTLSPINALGSNYTLYLPTIPVSQKIMTLDAAGNMSAPYVVDNSTIEIASNIIGVKFGGISTSQIAAGSVTGGPGGSIAASAITSFDIASGAVDNIGLANGAVVSSKIAAGAVTLVKQQAPNISNQTAYSTRSSAGLITANSFTSQFGRPYFYTISGFITISNLNVGGVASYTISNNINAALFQNITYENRGSNLIGNIEIPFSLTGFTSTLTSGSNNISVSIANNSSGFTGTFLVRAFASVQEL